MELISVAYMSRATRPISPAVIDQLLLIARANNAMRDITGVLVYGDGRFFQYFEGSQSDVSHVYARIRRSTLHTDITELEYRRVQERLFRKWFVTFRVAPTSLLQQLSREDWARERPRLQEHCVDSLGMQQLFNFLDEGVNDATMGR